MELMEIRQDLIDKAYDLRIRAEKAQRELDRDPEGAFGGRGNNFGDSYVERLDSEYSEAAKLLNSDELLIMTSRIRGIEPDFDRSRFCNVCQSFHKPTQTHKRQ